MEKNGLIKISLLLTVGAILGLIALFVTFTPGRATFQQSKVYVCHCQGNACNTLHIAPIAALAHLQQHEDDYRGVCEEVVPTPTKEPEVTPTPIEEVTPTPTEEVLPTPTDTVPQSNDKPLENNSTGTPGECGDVRPDRVANINVTTTGNTGELEVQWSLVENADRVHIEYGLEKYAQHALLDTPDDGNEVIRNLKSGEHYWFRVMAVNGCSVGQPSDWFDPLVP